MSFLEVPGARLHYETRGTGRPVMVIVPGSNGTGDPFQALAEHLAPDYTVVRYSRRGFSQSQVTGTQDYTHRLETDADDVRRLIEHVGDEPATVVGFSSGAIIALVTLTRHPSAVGVAVAYEPPAMNLLPDGQKWLAFFTELYDLYRQNGVPPAMKLFGERTFAESDRQTMAALRKRGNQEEIMANAKYWFEHELRQYPPVDLDIRALEAHANRVVPAAGRESHGYPCYEVAQALAKKLGLELTEMPGGHLGSVSHPAEFASELTQAINRAVNRP